MIHDTHVQHQNGIWRFLTSDDYDELDFAAFPVVLHFSTTTQFV